MSNLSFSETARLCMESLMEQYFDGSVGTNALFMAFSDGSSVDCAIAGKGENIISTLCSCCRDNDDVLKLMEATVANMQASVDVNDCLQQLIDKLKKIKDGDKDDEQ